ncbi:hypothetical protein AB0A95_33850 [Micromonospora sp. NPDC049230]|uniref:hypothetical protein n=1 Tax=Micromonospora sp. NPDC049230 TaxID=3155502 RepID=UPI0033CE4A18
MFDDDFWTSPEVLADQAANQAREDAETAALAAAAAARNAARAQQARPGSRRAGDRRFIGLVRRGRAVLVECGHEHTNRDWTTGANGISAVDCARRIIAGAARPATADRYATETRNRWLALTGQAGFVHSAATIEAAKATAAADAAAYLAAVAAVRDATLF